MSVIKCACVPFAFQNPFLIFVIFVFAFFYSFQPSHNLYCQTVTVLLSQFPYLLCIFDQLSGAVCTQNLVKIHNTYPLFLLFNLFVLFITPSNQLNVYAVTVLVLSSLIPVPSSSLYLNPFFILSNHIVCTAFYYLFLLSPYPLPFSFLLIPSSPIIIATANFFLSFFLHSPTLFLSPFGCLSLLYPCLLWRACRKERAQTCPAKPLRVPPPFSLLSFVELENDAP